MTDTPSRNNRELDTHVATARENVNRLVAHIKLGRLDEKYLIQLLSGIGQTMDEVIEFRKQSVRNEQLARLYKVSRMIGTSLDLQTVLDQVMDAIIQLTGAERGFLMLLENNELVVRVARNFDETTIESGAVSRTITHRVLDSKQAIVTTNAQEDPRFSDTNSIISNALMSIMASPLVRHGANDQVIGVMYVDNRIRKGLFSTDDLKLLDEFAEHAAIAIDNAVQVQQRESALKTQIRALQIEVDEVKRARQVKEIVETEYFQKLRDEAQRLRDRSNPKTDEG
jgi:GAF domain-containing protein